MELEGTIDELMFTIHAHPTLSEAMLDAYAAVEGMAINAYDDFHRRERMPIVQKAIFVIKGSLIA